MEEKRTLIFTYGTLKRGLPNHSLLQSTSAALVSDRCSTALPHPLVVGPNGIPFLLNLPGRGPRVRGELYYVPPGPAGLAAVDELEGLDRGHYERLPIAVICDDLGGEQIEAMAYFAHRGYGDRMWRRCGGEGAGIAEYSEREAAAYVRPGDRRPGATFLSELQRFLDEGEPIRD